MRKPPVDWNETQQTLYIARHKADQDKKRLDEITLTANPHSEEALSAIAALRQADKAFRRADAAWRMFIRDRLKRDPSWQVPDA